MGLIIAVVAAVTGIASLWWQIVTRRRGAHNVKVTAKAALVALSDGSVTDWQVNVRPENVGASPVTITGWGFELPGKRGSLYQVRRDNISTPSRTCWSRDRASACSWRRRVSGTLSARTPQT